VPAFHEAFADIVAIFQHFTFPELLRFEIGRSHGDLSQGYLMAEAGASVRPGDWTDREPGGHCAAQIGSKPSPRPVRPWPMRPHTRGKRIGGRPFSTAFSSDLQPTHRGSICAWASGGSGILRPGAIAFPTLSAGLADTAAKSAQHVLKLCIRALDYMPPVDPKLRRFPARP